MDRTLMTDTHQAEAPWAARLREREARTLAAAGQQRWLRVETGCVWLTRRDSHGSREDDIWLQAGQTHPLPARSAWVLEAWPDADVSVLQQAALSGPSSAAGTGRWWRRPLWLQGPLLHA